MTNMKYLLTTMCVLLVATMSLTADAQAMVRKRSNNKTTSQTQHAKSQAHTVSVRTPYQQPVSSPHSVDAPAVGKLTLYYVKSSTIKTGYLGTLKPGDFITDSYNSNFSMSDYSKSKYKLEMEYDSDPETVYIPKSNVNAMTYTTNKLAVSHIGQATVFKSKDGFTARIFRSHTNGHRYCDNDGASAPASWTTDHENCYVLSVEARPGDNDLFEEQLQVNAGYLDFYFDSTGSVSDNWGNPSSWDNNRSAFDSHGNLLCDQWSNEGYKNDGFYLAYIADMDALYFDGKLYYRQKDASPSVATAVTSPPATQNNDRLVSSNNKTTTQTRHAQTSQAHTVSVQTPYKQPVAATTTTKSNNALGTLLVCYANIYYKLEENDEGYYSPGQFVADNINHYEYIEKETANSYILHDWYGTKYTIAKSKMNVKRYTMSQLPVNSVGRSATFVSDDGFVARIFRSSNNGHHYYNLSDGSIMDQNKRPEGCYIFSAEYTYGPGSSKDYLFEEQIEIEGDHFKLYYKDWDNVRTVGSIDDTWVSNDDNWPNNRSTYDANGNLLTDLTEEPFDYYKSIAYIADLDALYFNGKLYYRQKDNAPTIAATTAAETNTSNEKVYKSVDCPPRFPGGDAALMKYLSSHIQYPTMAQENNIDGKVVVQFVVEIDGSIGEVKVVRSVDPDLDKEAVRVAKTLPHFIPGRQNGELVRVWYTLPVNFKLQRNEQEPTR